MWGFFFILKLWLLSSASGMSPSLIPPCLALSRSVKYLAFSSSIFRFSSTLFSDVSFNSFLSFSTLRFRLSIFSSFTLKSSSIYCFSCLIFLWSRFLTNNSSKKASALSSADLCCCSSSCLYLTRSDEFLDMTFLKWRYLSQSFSCFWQLRRVNSSCALIFSSSSSYYLARTIQMLSLTFYWLI